MDDLISRKALGERIKALKHQIASQAAGFVDEDSYECGAVDGLYDALTYTMEAPFVPAVPMDKLCEWLTANRVSIPCRLCEYDDAGECTVQNDMSKPCPNTTRDWRRVITNWMEGLDAAD